MSLFLVVLLWICAGWSSIAMMTLLPKADRHDYFRLLEIICYLGTGPLCFLFAALGMLLRWADKMNPIVWRRK